MKQKTIKITAIGAGAILLAMLGIYLLQPLMTGHAAAETPIRIGFIGPLSLPWGQGSLNMLTMAVEEINEQGGIAGRKLEVIAEDGQCKPQPAVTAAQKLIQADRVKFIIGGHCSPETAAIAPLLEENKVFGLAGTSTATGMLDDYSYMFRTSPHNLDQGRKLAKLAVEKYGLKDIAMLTEQTTYAKSITDDFRTALLEIGGNVSTESEFAPGSKDLRTELMKIQSRNPDAIFLSPQTQDSARALLEAIKELGIRTSIFGNTVVISKIACDGQPDLLPDDAFTVSPYVDPAETRVAELIRKYRTEYGTDVPYNLFFVGAVYDGMYMLRDALENCGEDPACVRDYFQELDGWDGITADYTFDSNGDPTINNWKELNIVGGKEVFREIK